MKSYAVELTADEVRALLTCEFSDPDYDAPFQTARAKLIEIAGVEPRLTVVWDDARKGRRA